MQGEPARALSAALAFPSDDGLPGPDGSPLPLLAGIEAKNDGIGEGVNPPGAFCRRLGRIRLSGPRWAGWALPRSCIHQIRISSRVGSTPEKPPRGHDHQRLHRRWQDQHGKQKKTMPGHGVAGRGKQDALVVDCDMSRPGADATGYKRRRDVRAWIEKRSISAPCGAPGTVRKGTAKRRALCGLPMGDAGGDARGQCFSPQSNQTPLGRPAGALRTSSSSDTGPMPGMLKKARDGLAKRGGWCDHGSGRRAAGSRWWIGP